MISWMIAELERRKCELFYECVDGREATNQRILFPEPAEDADGDQRSIKKTKKNIRLP